MDREDTKSDIFRDMCCFSARPSDMTAGEFEFKTSEKEKKKLDTSYRVEYMNGDSLSFKSLRDMRHSEHFSKISKDIANGDVLSIEYPVLAFVADSARSRFLRISGSSVGVGVRKSIGKPIVRDHMLSSESESGIITDGVEGTYRNRPAMRLRLSAREPSFQAKLIRGLYTRYSMSFDVDTGNMSCSICGEKCKESKYGLPQMSCNHELGVSYGGDRAKFVANISDVIEISSTPAPRVKEASVIGPKFSLQQQEMEPEMDNEKNTDFAQKYSELSAEFSSVKVENDRLKVELGELKSSLEDAISEAKKANEIASKYALESLEESRIITSEKQRQSFSRIAGALGLDEAVEHFKEFSAPQKNLSNTSAGSTGGNPETVPGAEPTTGDDSDGGNGQKFNFGRRHKGFGSLKEAFGFQDD